MMKLNPQLSVAGLCLFLMVGISWQAGAYDEDDLEKLKATGDCSGCNLSKANLTGANLYGADLKGSNLTNANLTNAIMKDAHIPGIIFCRTQTPWGEDNSGC